MSRDNSNFSGSIICSIVLLTILGLDNAQCEVLIRSGPEKEIYGAWMIERTIWVVTQDRILWNASKLPEWDKRFPETDSEEARIGVRVVAEVDNKTWIGTDQGVFEIGEDSYRKQGLGEILDGSPVQFIEQDRLGDIWIATPYAVYRRDALIFGATLMFNIEDGESQIGVFKIIGDEIFVGTDMRLIKYKYSAKRGHWEEGELVLGTQDLGLIKRVESIGGVIYVVAAPGRSQCLYRVEDGYSLNMACGIIDIKEIGEELWYSTTADIDKGAGGRYSNLVYRCRGCRHATDYLGVPGHEVIQEEVDAIAYLNGYVWFCTSEGIFRWRKDSHGQFEAFVIKRKSQGNNSPYPFFGLLQSIDGTIWATGENGLYRIYEDVNIQVMFNTLPLPRDNRYHVLFADGFRIESSSYSRDGHNPFPSIDGQFQEAIDFDKDEFYKRIERPEEFSKLGTIELDDELKPIFSKVHIGIRDRFGNILALHDNIIIRDSTLGTFRRFIGWAIIVSLSFFLTQQARWPYLRCCGLWLMLWMTRVPVLKAVHDRFLTTSAVRLWLRKIYISNVDWSVGCWGEGATGSRMACRLVTDFSMIYHNRQSRIFNILIENNLAGLFLRTIACIIARSDGSLIPWGFVVPVVVQASSVAKDVTGTNFVENVVVKQFESVAWCLDKRSFSSFVDLGSAAVLLHANGNDAAAMNEIKAFAQNVRSFVIIVSENEIKGAKEMVDLRGLSWQGV